MPIVMIDDSPTALAVLKSFAGARGERHIVAYTKPVEALEYLSANAADAIVVDCAMPEMNGIEFTQRLRQMALHRDTPIVMVAGNDGTDLHKRALSAGVNTFLEKPVKVTQFKYVLSSVLANGGWPLIDRRADWRVLAQEATERRAQGPDDQAAPLPG